MISLAHELFMSEHYPVTLITKELKPKNIFYRNEVQYRDDVPTKRKIGM